MEIAYPNGLFVFILADPEIKYIVRTCICSMVYCNYARQTAPNQQKKRKKKKEKIKLQKTNNKIKIYG